MMILSVSIIILSIIFGVPTMIAPFVVRREMRRANILAHEFWADAEGRDKHCLPGATQAHDFILSGVFLAPLYASGTPVGNPLGVRTSSHDFKELIAFLEANAWAIKYVGTMVASLLACQWLGRPFRAKSAPIGIFCLVILCTKSPANNPYPKLTASNLDDIEPFYRAGHETMQYA